MISSHLCIRQLCVLIMFLSYFNGIAQENSQPITEYQQSKEERKLSGSVLSSKLHIAAAKDQLQRGKEVTAQVGTPELLTNSEDEYFLQRNNDEIGVVLRTHDISNLLPKLKGIGFHLTGVVERYGRIEGFIRKDRLLSLENFKNDGLLSASSIHKPILKVGSVTSEGVDAMGVSQLRQERPDADGRGVTIGLISDSYDNLGGEAAGVASGDLPNDVVVIQDLDAGGSDEGRALCEVAFDVAPGADLMFATGAFGQANFADNIQALADAGCEVIADDLGYFAEPFFQDGIVAQKVDEVALTQEVLYYSAAGNASDNSYESTDINFVSPGTIGGLADYDFDPSPADNEDVFQQINLGPGEVMLISLQWDDPFFTVDQVDTDLDIFLFDEPPVNVIAASNTDNILSQSPVEVLIHQNQTGSTQTFNILINKFVGPDPARIKYVNFAPTHDPLEYDTKSPTIVGHPAAENAIAVGAIFHASNTIEPFSSIGPSTILFEADGSPIPFSRTNNPEDDGVVRQKPDISAADGVSTTFFGSPTGGMFPAFFGTSAAAPHSAGIGAIYKSLLPGLGLSDYEFLQNIGATDILDGIGGNIGIDDFSGFGGGSANSSGLPNDVIFADGFESGDAASWTDGNRPGNVKAGGPNNDIRTIIAINRVSSDRQEPVDLIFMSGNTLDLRPNFEVPHGFTFELKILDFLIPFNLR